MRQTEEINIDLKSEPMNEMLSQPPKWIIKSGSGMFLIILMVLFLLSWLIKYPDEITGEILVTTSKPPIELSNQSYIQLRSLNVVERQQVKQGDLIAQFDIHAKSDDVSKAINYINELEKINGQFKPKIPEFNQPLQLGSFQEQWMLLHSKIIEWNTEHIESLLSKEISSIAREISYREQLQEISDKKIKLSEGEYELIKEQLLGSERLVEQNAISKQTLNQDKRNHTQAMQTVQAQKEQHVQNLIALNTLRKEKFQLEYDLKLKELQKASEIQISLSALGTAFKTWEDNSIWIAPCSGKVLFNKILQVNRYYKANEASIVIVPKGSDYSAIATIKSSGAGKVKVGQKTFIELIDYPKTEFGMLEGRVSGITQIDKEGKYEVKVDLPNKLKTTYNKIIPSKAQLKGTVKVITKDKRLLGRLFEQLADLIK